MKIVGYEEFMKLKKGTLYAIGSKNNKWIFYRYGIKASDAGCDWREAFDIGYIGNPSGDNCESYDVLEHHLQNGKSYEYSLSCHSILGLEQEDIDDLIFAVFEQNEIDAVITWLKNAYKINGVCDE